MKVLVPEYYNDFKCKCERCRSCCCTGWGVTISYEEYCNLLGLNCTQKLRAKLDCAFFVLNDATKDRYAKMKPNYLGECPLRDSDGLCLLQKECGEKNLPIICKMYPRNSYLNVLNEWACANSCEGVLDILFSYDKPISFFEIEDSQIKEKQISIEHMNSYIEIQKMVNSILQNREISFNARLIKLGEYIEVIDDIHKDSIILQDPFADAVLILSKLLPELEEYSPSFSKISIFIDNDLGVINGVQTYDVKKIEQEYLECLDHYKKILSKFEVYFENMFVNHLDFIRFPYSEINETIWDQYIELCGVYSISKFISVIYMKDKKTLDDFIDCMAGLFRCFEHSNANEVILCTLKKLGEATHSHLMNLICI